MTNGKPGHPLALLNYYFRSKEKLFEIIMIPKDFERGLVTASKSNLFLAVNAINGTKASVG